MSAQAETLPGIGPPRSGGYRRLGDLATQIRETILPDKTDERSYLALEHIDSGDIVARRQGTSVEVRSAKFAFRRGDVLYGKLRPYLDKAVLATFDGVASTELLVLRARPDVDPQFLAFAMHSQRVQKHAVDTTAGVNHPRTSWENLRDLDIYCPPLEDQRRVARILATVQHAKDASNLELKRSIDLKLTMVRDAFQLEGHQIVSCADVCEVLSVGIVVRPAQYYTSDGVLALRSQNVREDELDLKDVVRIDRAAHQAEVAKSALRPGDVVIVRTGYPGTSAVIPVELTEVNCIDLVFARPSSRVHPEYLSRFFNSPSGRRQALAAKTGLAQQHLNVGAVARTQLPLPPPDIQRTIVERLRSVDRVIKAIRNDLACLDALFAATLRKMMGSSE